MTMTMTMANVETIGGNPPDDIMRQHQELVEKITSLEILARAGKEIEANPAFVKIRETLEAEAHARAVAAFEPGDRNEKVKAFPPDYDRVNAIRTVFRDVDDRIADWRQELSSAKLARTKMEHDNELFFQAGETTGTGPTAENPDGFPAAPEPGVVDEAPATLHIITDPLKGKGKIAIKHALEKAGYAYIEQSGAREWHWTAPEKGGAILAYELARPEVGKPGSVYLNCFASVPGQLEIAVPDDADAQPAPALIGEGNWRECVVILPADMDEDDDDLVETLDAMGVNTTATVLGDGSSMYTAPYTAELFQWLNDLKADDERIVEVFRR